jgi:hypothetical protein
MALQAVSDFFWPPKVEPAFKEYIFRDLGTLCGVAYAGAAGVYSATLAAKGVSHLTKGHFGSAARDLTLAAVSAYLSSYVLNASWDRALEIWNSPDATRRLIALL